MFQQASTEAANAFGNGDMYMEKFIERPRHIEFQVLADEHGNVMSLGERECSIQRRHQKLIEEAPSLMVTPKLREELGKTIKKALEWAKDVGYPVILKAVAGGGGRGMRICRNAEELPSMYQQASTEAANAFGNGDMYMEKFIERPRHIEFQVLADEHGNVMSLGERECSIQRRHQKLIEEAPSLMVSPKLREELGKTIKKALENIGYWNAGTIEFLMDEDGKIYFIEMNTRIQVEHCVTEMVTGIDLVKAQLRIAAGEKLTSIITKPVEIRGHAIECRINAEHPEKFTPSAGKITAFNLPGGNGVRVDTAQYAEGIVPPYYDSLIAKLICHGADREESMNKMQRALSQFVVQGIHTTIPLHQKIFADAEFRAGQFDTKFMERFFERQKES